MKKKKTIIAALILLLLLIIGGTVAYFTDTDDKTNTFTLGNVKIKLVEDAYDEAVAAGETTDILPGVAVAKDPAVKNEGNNAAFVFVEVEVDCVANEPLFTYDVKDGWTKLKEVKTCDPDEKQTVLYYYGAGDELTELGKGETSTTLFDEVTLDKDLTTAAVASLESTEQKINVKAYGIQSKGLAAPVNPETVWANFNGNSGSAVCVGGNC